MSNEDDNIKYFRSNHLNELFNQVIPKTTCLIVSIVTKLTFVDDSISNDILIDELNNYIKNVSKNAPFNEEYKNFLYKELINVAGITIDSNHTLEEYSEELNQIWGNDFDSKFKTLAGAFMYVLLLPQSDKIEFEFEKVLTIMYPNIDIDEMLLKFSGYIKNKYTNI